MRNIKHALRVLRNGHLPCYVIHQNPLIVISYFDDFIKNRDLIVNKIYKQSTGFEPHLLFQLGYHVESQKRVDEIAEEIKQLKDECPDLNFTFLTNSERESDNIHKLGEKAIFCHQNAFLDEKHYPIVNSKKRYDAIYLARISPFKRHELAVKIRSLKLIGAYKHAETAYFQKIMKLMAHASYKKKVRSFNVSKVFSEARVGLCLSAEEGAMFVSTEYLLSGIPVVTTTNKGGRNYLMPKRYMLEVNDTPDAVAEGVDLMKQKEFSPHEIRAETIKLMNYHRQRLVKYINLICKEQNLGAFSEDFPHKFCLRMKVPFQYRNRML